MRLPRVWTPHTVTVTPREGVSARGPIFGTPVEVPDVYVKDVQETVVDETGAEVLSRASIRFNLDDLPTIGSKVTVWKGTDLEYEATIFKASRHSHPAWPAVGVGWLK